jgi:hypothetical protein
VNGSRENVAAEPKSSSIRSSGCTSRSGPSAERTRLDLPGVRRHDQVGDRRVLGLAGAVGDDGRPAVAVRQLDRSSVSLSVPIWFSLMRMELAQLLDEALRQPLVFVTNRSSPTIWTLSPERLGQGLPAVPVVLGEAVLDRDDRVVARQILVEVDHLAVLRSGFASAPRTYLPSR